MVNTVDLIVPKDKKDLVFDPKYSHIFGSIARGFSYIPTTDSNGNWVFTFPSEIAKSILECGDGELFLLEEKNDNIVQ